MPFLWRESGTWRSVETWRGDSVASTITNLAVTPTSVTLPTGTTEATVTLSWTLPPEPIASQTIYQKINAGPFTQIATPGPLIDDYAVDVSVGSYQWYVTTTNTSGTSGPSNTVTLQVVEAAIVIGGGGAGGGPPTPVLPTTRLWVGIITPDGTLDVSATADAITWSTNAHGAHQAVVLLDGKDAESVTGAFARGAIVVRISSGSDYLWSGVVEDWILRGTRLQVVAYGMWSFVSLVPYTEFWSTTRSNDWKPHPGMGTSWPLGNAGAVDTDWGLKIFEDRLRFAPRLRYEYYYTEYGWVTFRIPTGGRQRTIRQFQCSWSYARMSNDPHVFISLFAFGDVGGTHQVIYDPVTFAYGRWELLTSSAPANGSVTIQLEAGITEIGLAIHLSPTTGTFPGTEGQPYFDLYPRVLSTTAATVTPTAIVTDILGHVNTHNPGVISTAASQVTNVTTDLPNVHYEDADPAEVLRKLAGYGVPGGATPLDVGVGVNSQLYFRLPPAAGTHDIPNMRTVREVILHNAPDEARYSLSNLINAAYGTYDTPYGTERTTPTIDSASVTRFGRKRMRPIAALTGNAQLQPQQLLVNDNASVRPAVEVTITDLFDAYGQIVPLWDVRSGDWLVVSAPQPGMLSEQPFQLRVRILETQYDAPNNRLTVVLEQSPPRLDVIISQLMLNQ